MGGADSAGEFTELRGQKFDSVAAGLPFHLVEDLAQWFEQRVTGPRNATADDSGFAIKNVDERANGGRECFDGSEPDFCGGGVAGVVRRDEIVRGLESAARALLDRIVADGDFEGAGSAGAIGRAVWIERDVTQVTRAPDVPAEQTAIDHGRATDAGAEREHDDILQATGCADPDFTEKRGVGVIQNRNWKRSLEVVGPDKSFNALQSLRKKGNGAGIARGQAGCGNTDGDRWGILMQFGNESANFFRPLKFFVRVETAIGFREDCALRRDRHRLDAGAAEIDANGVAHFNTDLR